MNRSINTISRICVPAISDASRSKFMIDALEAVESYGLELENATRRIEASIPSLALEEELNNWEDFFGVNLSGTTTADRVKMLLTMFSRTGFFNIDYINSIAKLLTGYNITVFENPEKFHFEIQFNELYGEPDNKGLFTNIIDNNKPAHLTWNYRIRNNTYENCQPYTYGYLEQFTNFFIYTGNLVTGDTGNDGGGTIDDPNDWWTDNPYSTLTYIGPDSTYSKFSVGNMNGASVITGFPIYRSQPSATRMDISITGTIRFSDSLWTKIESKLPVLNPFSHGQERPAPIIIEDSFVVDHTNKAIQFDYRGYQCDAISSFVSTLLISPVAADPSVDFIYYDMTVLETPSPFQEFQITGGYYSWTWDSSLRLVPNTGSIINLTFNPRLVQPVVTYKIFLDTGLGSIDMKLYNYNNLVATRGSVKGNGSISTDADGVFEATFRATNAGQKIFDLQASVISELKLYAIKN